MGAPLGLVKLGIRPGSDSTTARPNAISMTKGVGARGGDDLGGHRGERIQYGIRGARTSPTETGLAGWGRENSNYGIVSPKSV